MSERPSIVVDEPPVITQDNLRVAVYDVAALRAAYPNWDVLPKQERKRRCRLHAPTMEATAHNVTCIGWHEECAARFNFKNDVRDPAAEIALGNDAAPTGGFSVSDTSLSNEVGRIDLTDPSNTGDTWGFSEYLSSVELNGYTLREMGVVSQANVLWNHAELPTFVNKDSNTAVIFDGSVPFGDQSEV